MIATDNHLKWATYDLHQMQTEVGPDVECYRAAWQRVEMVRDRLRHHDRTALIDHYRIDRIPHLAAQVDALDTWRRWACGDSINVQPLSEAVDTLLFAGDHCRASRELVQEWSGHSGYPSPSHAFQHWSGVPTSNCHKANGDRRRGSALTSREARWPRAMTIERTLTGSAVTTRPPSVPLAGDRPTAGSDTGLCHR